MKAAPARTKQLWMPEMEQATEHKTAPVSVWAPIFSILAAALFAWALWQGSDWGLRARLFPWVIGSIGLPLTVVQFALDLRRITKRKPPEKSAAPSAEGDAVAVYETRLWKFSQSGRSAETSKSCQFSLKHQLNPDSAVGISVECRV